MIIKKRNYIFRIFVSISLLCLVPLGMRAQFNMLFTSDQDLPNSLVNKIAEDRLGVIWIATEDGLSRFNGSRFVNYNNIKNNPNSLAHNFVRTVCTDSHGNVIIGSIAGVQQFRPHTDDFTPVIQTKSIGIEPSNVNTICKMKDREFFVGGNDAYTLVIDENGNAGVKRNALTGKVTDIQRSTYTKEGCIWVARQSKGVIMADKQGKIHHIKDYDGSEYNIARFCNGNDGRLYAADVRFGLYVYNTHTQHFDKIPGTESMVKIRDVKAMPNSNILCVATDGDGVMFFDTHKRQMVSSKQFEDPFIDISAQKVHSLYINKEGDIWMGLYQKGIFMASKTSAPFGYIGRKSQKYDLIGDCCVTSIVEARNGDIWVATDNGGIFGFSPAFDTVKKFPVSHSMNGIPSTVQGIFNDSKDRLWFGSYNMGGGILNKENGSCTFIPIEGVADKAYSLFGFAEDKRGCIWAAAMGKGIYYFDEAKHIFHKYTDKNGTTWTSNIFYDQYKDIVYAGTYDGIVYFSPTDKHKTTHTIEPHAIVYGIKQLSANTIAFATTEGLILLDTNTKKINKLTIAEGLPSNNVLSIEKGTKGHLWLSTNNGLVRLNLENMATETFTSRDGLQGNEFYKNASLHSKDGRLWFGGINGITVFSPQKIASNNISCTVRVVNLSAGERYIFRDDKDGYTLPCDVTAFTMELATLPIVMTHRVAYSYKMDDGDWEILTVPQNNVTFNNLGYGHHTLYTKTTIDGHESETTTTAIYIEYPWYLSWWACILWIIILAFAIRFAIIQARRRAKDKMTIMEHEKEEELKEQKLQFFMNVVHDLRTPITLISTPLQKLISTDEEPTHQHVYNIINRNADRLLRLTDQIMDLRKIDRGKMELSCQEVSISPFFNSIVSCMDDISQSKRQTLTFIDHTDGTINAMLDPDCMEKILINLLSNALKYTLENGKVSVELEVSDFADGQNAEELEIKVTDTGIGIPDEEKKKIFTRFYQVKRDSKHIKGTGIGLNLVHALVELCHGTISVTDNPEGQGTCFTVEVPFKLATQSTERPVVQPTEQPLTEKPIEQKDFSPRSRTGREAHKTLLIVDDDDEIRSFLCEEMAVLYNVIDCADGKTAYDIINKEKIDLVVSDVMMPEIDGIELTKKIRENIRLSHIPIVLLTAKAGDQDRIEGLQANADAYVTKPFNLELLQTLISNLLLKQDSLKKTINNNILPAEKIETPTIESVDDKLMERLMRVINENLDNPDLTSEYLASEVGLSRVHLYRKLKELTNQSATNYIRNIRLTKAAEMLRQRKTTISEVAYKVGFRSPNHFSTAFKELYGVSPKEYVHSEVHNS